MPTQLTVFNDALLMLGQALLDSPNPSPTNERSRILNASWQPAVEYCLEQAAWDFAEKRAKLAQVTPAPSFGYDFYYNLPADCLRLTYASETGHPQDDLLHYAIEEGKIATNAGTVYIKYVSSEAMNHPGRWSSTFARLVSARLAVMVAPKLNASALEHAKDEFKRAKAEAPGIDAVQNPPAFRKPGNLVRAIKTGSRRFSPDGGPTSSLT